MPLDYSVLVLDDDPTFLDALCRRFYDLGYGVTPLSHPRRALAAASLRHFDVALLGCNSPEEGGIALMTKICATAPHRPLTILLSESVDPCYRKQALAAGAFACLGKCGQLGEVEAAVARALETDAP